MASDLTSKEYCGLIGCSNASACQPEDVAGGPATTAKSRNAVRVELVPPSSPEPNIIASSRDCSSAGTLQHDLLGTSRASMPCFADRPEREIACSTC